MCGIARAECVLQVSTCQREEGVAARCILSFYMKERTEGGDRIVSYQNHGRRAARGIPSILLPNICNLSGGGGIRATNNWVVSTRDSHERDGRKTVGREQRKRLHKYGHRSVCVHDVAEQGLAGGTGEEHVEKRNMAVSVAGGACGGA